MSSTLCPCGSEHSLGDCCGRYHAGLAAPSAEALMRSRYSAYVLALVDYLVGTTLPAQQEALDRESIRQWSTQSTWLGLEVKRAELLPGNPEHAWVTFEAHWRDAAAAHSHEERSAFVRHDQRWYFIDPTAPLKAGRNDPCPCGSLQKFKKCCAAYVA